MANKFLNDSILHWGSNLVFLSHLSLISSRRSSWRYSITVLWGWALSFFRNDLWISMIRWLVCRIILQYLILKNQWLGGPLRLTWVSISEWGHHSIHLLYVPLYKVRCIDFLVTKFVSLVWCQVSKVLVQKHRIVNFQWRIFLIINHINFSFKRINCVNILILLRFGNGWISANVLAFVGC